MATEKETIDFVPHPNTLTSTGDQNYRDSDRGKKAFPFAIAEKIVSLVDSRSCPVNLSSSAVGQFYFSDT